MKEEEYIDPIIIEPTPEVVQYLFDCGDIALSEYLKYQEDPEYQPKLKIDYE
tara:strand:- start:232 stop:387 length:156 start_codon:yes stop_codon:yes gene_type:complete